ncbi:MAG: ATP-binding protein [Betaproteobacteria bacterium]|nr:ATP-binding protein [Betaproteobacteria bacterium]
MFKPRVLELPNSSFFLFGPRNTGKSTWLKNTLPKNSLIIDLLSHNNFLELSRNPSLLEARIPQQTKPDWIWIDEVQRIPELLNEVHRLIEEKGYRFALSGSSARKLRRGGANLLAGRAQSRRMEGFSYRELGDSFEISKAIQWGCLPFLWTQTEDKKIPPEEFLSSYLNTYIKEEIREEGLVRRLEPFLRFLEIAGLLNGQIINANAIAREASIPRSSVDSYFSILEDTLMGNFLPAYAPGAQVREVSHPKFYWFDNGVARVAAGLHRQNLDNITQGTLLETLIFHELRVYMEAKRKEWPIRYYAVPSGGEIDFVVETSRKTLNSPPEVALIEVKLAQKWKREWEKPSRTLASSQKIRVTKMIGIYLGENELQFENFRVLPFQKFSEELWNSQLLG